MAFKYDLEKDGITQGLLSTFMQCREKTKLSMQGWSTKLPSMGMTYGTVGHAVLEMAYMDIQSQKLKTIPTKAQVLKYIASVEEKWRKDSPRASAKELEFLELSLLIAEATLPMYFEYWEKDIKDIKWIGLEHEFKIPYTTISGVKTVLRGKMDGVFSNSKKVWLFESKFKSRLDEDDLMDTLPRDLQVLFYLYALKCIHKVQPAGFLYNITRRIGLKQGKNEDIVTFGKRCVDDIKERPEFYFIRREVSIGKDELDAFEVELANLIQDFVNWQSGKGYHYCNTPNSCLEKYGRCTYLDICCGRGYGMYVKRDTMYRELEGV